MGPQQALPLGKSIQKVKGDGGGPLNAERASLNLLEKKKKRAQN